MSATRMLVSWRHVQRSAPRHPSDGSAGPPSPPAPPFPPDGVRSPGPSPAENASSMPSGR
ncbi:Uncharacterised protein [Mycobacteroides abscessus]|nr:Uncharacterised protein [Mycobacteroides abscessus]